jgi:hypothetical protein
MPEKLSLSAATRKLVLLLREWNSERPGHVQSGPDVLGVPARLTLRSVSSGEGMMLSPARRRPRSSLRCMSKPGCLGIFRPGVQVSDEAAYRHMELSRSPEFRCATFLEYSSTSCDGAYKMLPISTGLPGVLQVSHCCQASVI